VIFGLAFSLLLIATYPERKNLIPSRATTPGPEEKPAATEPEKEPDNGPEKEPA
jgi:hypothetical protein